MLITAAPAIAASTPGDLDRYYAQANGKSGAELLSALHRIVRTGHHDLGYGPAREQLFGTVDDPDGDDRVPDLFTGELRGPIRDTSSAAGRGFNTEHTWPQSKGARGIARADLHHLRASDKFTNAQRGNGPYGDVARVKWSVGEGAHQARLGVDLLGKQVFEPMAASKGDIARGLLYFYTRYAAEPTDDFSLDNFRHELPTLLKWHELDPVDDFERSRNDAIQLAQGNRNPFIDRPEFVTQADFEHLQLRGR